MDSGLIFLFAVVIVLSALLLFYVTLSQKGSTRLDVDKYRKRFIAIERQLNKNDANTYQLAVLNADKLLDFALKEKGVKGETMGDRMKASKEMWSNANSIWSAHKLRNTIAHEPDAKISYDDARRALANFKTGLRDLGAI